jgi:anti-sigma factor RsiW
VSACETTEEASISVTCREVTDALHDYLSGELPPEQTAEVDQHLATCVDCENYLAAYQHTLTLTKDAFDPGAAPPDIPEALVKAIMAARRRN